MRWLLSWADDHPYLIAATHTATVLILLGSTLAGLLR